MLLNHFFHFREHRIDLIVCADRDPEVVLDPGNLEMAHENVLLGEPVINISRRERCGRCRKNEVRARRKNAIFDSISRPNYKSEFDFETLKKASKAGLIDKNTIALGGISIDKIKMLKDLGFGGVMISGDLWSRFNIYSTTDYQELIKYFREIRKAVG